MWEKLKAFFQNKATKIVAWVVLACDVVCLIFGETAVAEITKGVELTAVIVAAVAALVAFIAERVKK